MKIQEIIYRGCEDEDCKLSQIFNMQIRVRDRSNSNVIREFCSLSYSLPIFLIKEYYIFSMNIYQRKPNSNILKEKLLSPITHTNTRIITKSLKNPLIRL